VKYGPLVKAAERVRTPEDGYALLLAAVFWRAFRDLRTVEHGHAAACWLSTPAAHDWAAAINLTLPAHIVPMRRQVERRSKGAR